MVKGMVPNNLVPTMKRFKQEKVQNDYKSAKVKSIQEGRLLSKQNKEKYSIQGLHMLIALLDPTLWNPLYEEVKDKQENIRYRPMRMVWHKLWKRFV